MANHLVSEPDAVAQEMGLTEHSLEHRRKAVGLDAEDLVRIKRVRDLVSSHADEVCDSFFTYLASIEETRDFMRKTAVVEQARRAKSEHLTAMVGGVYGLEYALQRVRLAVLYSRGGLDMRVFVAAFHHLLRSLGSLIMKGAGASAQAYEDFLALSKVAFLDLSLIIDVMAFERERTISRQQDAIRELSTPVLQIRDRLLMLPIIGTIDTHRARMLTEGLLHAIRANRAKVVVMDVTGVAAVDTKVANHLLQTVAASKLMGATVIVTGLSADVSQTLVNLGVDLTGLQTIGDLQGGIEEAESLIGYQVTRVARSDGAGVRMAST